MNVNARSTDDVVLEEVMPYFLKHAIINLGDLGGSVVRVVARDLRSHCSTPGHRGAEANLTFNLSVSGVGK